MRVEVEPGAPVVMASIAWMSSDDGGFSATHDFISPGVLPDTHTFSHTHMHTHTHTHIDTINIDQASHVKRERYKQTKADIGIHTETGTDLQTDGQTDRQAEYHTHLCQTPLANTSKASIDNHV